MPDQNCKTIDEMSLPPTNFDRERLWWDAKAPREESDSADESINRALRWREIEHHLDQVESILDIGGGTGAFSIPLARRGFRVTHVDLSPEMLALARKNAEGLKNLEFVEARASDLGHFRDRSFDLVLNMDGAISFSGDQALLAIRETCRISKAKIILTVSHLARMAASWVGSNLSSSQKLGPAVEAMFQRGEWHTDQFPGNKILAEGLTQNYLGALKAFLPRELREILKAEGWEVLRCGGLGSLAGLCNPEALLPLTEDRELMKSFLSLCEEFDQEILCDGPGTRLRAGLIAVARRAG